MDILAIVWKREQKVQNNDSNKKLEAQGPCTGHRSIIAILYCFSFEYMKSTQIYVN